jgi:molecular chaperone DnaK (HSP70)
VRTAGGVMTPVIDRNTSIPVKAHKKFSTSIDNQTCISISIYEGEMPLVKDCVLLGKCTLDGLPIRPRGELVVVVTFAIDENGILNVTAKEQESGASCRITLNSGMTTLNDIDTQHEAGKRVSAHDTHHMNIVHRKADVLNSTKEIRKAIPALKRNENIPNAKINDLEQYVVQVDGVLTNQNNTCDLDTMNEFTNTLDSLMDSLRVH